MTFDDCWAPSRGCSRLRKPSDLMQRSIAQFIHVASGGLTGEIARLLKEAAALAVLDGSEHITLAHLEHVAIADH